MWQPTDSFVLFTTQKQWKYLLNADTQDDSLLLPATKFSNFFFFFIPRKHLSKYVANSVQGYLFAVLLLSASGTEKDNEWNY